MYEELKIDYKNFNIPKEKGFKFIKSDEYAKINPNGTVPTIIFDNGEVAFEAGAIIDNILKRYKKEAKVLIPDDWTEEQVYRNNLYAFWVIATIDQRIMSLKQFANIFLGQSIGAYLVSSNVKDWFQNEVCPILEKDLGDNDYINGNSFSMTDIYLGLSLAHFHHAGILNLAPKKVQNYYLNKILTRPTFVKSCEGIYFNFGIEKEKKN